MVGTEGDDELTGTDGPDVLCGLGGNDVLRGLAGDDDLRGGDGGFDTISYADAPTGVAVDLAAGSAFGDGADVVTGDAGMDQLHGGPGANVCHALPDAGVESGCWGPSPFDPRETRGPLDVRRVRTRLRRPRPVWKVTTRARWTARSIWDEGYVVVLLDTRGGPEPDHYALARSTKHEMTATLYRVRANARDRPMRGGVKAWRTNARSVTIRIALGRVGLDSLRPYYRWGVETLFTGRRCRLLCIDPVGFGGAMFPQPRF